MNRSTNTKRTLEEWNTYIKVLEEELAVRAADSNALAKIIGVVNAWEDIVSDAGCDTIEVDKAALDKISEIATEHGGWEGLSRIGTDT